MFPKGEGTLLTIMNKIKLNKCDLYVEVCIFLAPALSMDLSDVVLHLSLLIKFEFEFGYSRCLLYSLCRFNN